MRNRLVLGFGITALLIGSLLGVSCGDDDGDSDEPSATEEMTDVTPAE